VEYTTDANGIREPIQFADRCKLAITKPKGLVAKLSGVVKKVVQKSKKAEEVDFRFLVVTDKSLCCIHLQENLEFKRSDVIESWRVQFNQIKSITLSTLPDGYMVFHFNNPNVDDCVVGCRRKTEFLAFLAKAMQDNGCNLQLEFKNEDQILIDPKKTEIPPSQMARRRQRGGSNRSHFLQKGL
jgi:hypothetical protein